MDDQSARVTKLRQLTARELEVFRLVCEGKLGSEIAKSLFISGSTVLFHRGNIYDKLGLSELRQGAPRQSEMHRYCAALDSLRPEDVPSNSAPSRRRINSTSWSPSRPSKTTSATSRKARRAREGLILSVSQSPGPTNIPEPPRTRADPRASA